MKNKFVLCLTFLIVLSIIGLGEDNWLNQGAALRAEGKYDDALEAFEKSIELNPENSLPWYYKGIIYSDQMKYDEALQSIEKAIELNPQLDIAWYNKGSVLKELGRDSEAVAALGKFAELLCDRFSTEHKAMQP